MFVFLLPVGKPAQLISFYLHHPGLQNQCSLPWLWPLPVSSIPRGLLTHLYTWSVLSSHPSLAQFLRVYLNFSPILRKAHILPLPWRCLPIQPVRIFPSLELPGIHGVHHPPKALCSKGGLEVSVCHSLWKTSIPWWQGLARTYAARYFLQGPANSGLLMGWHVWVTSAWCALCLECA